MAPTGIRSSLPSPQGRIDGAGRVTLAGGAGECPLPRTLWIELTHRCNLRCVHCFVPGETTDDGRGAELDTSAWVALLDRRLPELGVARVVLTGGEPLLRSDLPVLAARIRAAGARLSLISNGGLIDRRRARELADLGVGDVQLTLSGGDRATHEDLSGPGTFDGTLAAFQALRAAGITPLGSFICTARNPRHAGAVVSLLGSMGIRWVAFNRYAPCGAGTERMRELLPTRSQVLVALAGAEDAAAEHGVTVSVTMPIPPCVVDPRRYPHLRFGSCSAGSASAAPAVGPDGSLRLCALQRRAIGSLVDRSLAALPYRSEASRFRAALPAFCRGCRVATTCLGGCGAAAEWTRGDPAELDPFVAQHVVPDFWTRVRQHRSTVDG